MVCLSRYIFISFLSILYKKDLCEKIVKIGFSLLWNDQYISCFCQLVSWYEMFIICKNQKHFNIEFIKNKSTYLQNLRNLEEMRAKQYQFKENDFGFNCARFCAFKWMQYTYTFNDNSLLTFIKLNPINKKIRSKYIYFLMIFPLYGKWRCHVAFMTLW